MDRNCNDEQIKKDGSSQGSRFLPSLDSVSASLDDRTPEDILVFAKHYADLVRFYDIDEKPEWANIVDENIYESDAVSSNKKIQGKNIYTWKEFFYNDIAVVIASIAHYRDKLDAIRHEYDDKRKQTLDNPNVENYRELFLTIVHLLQRIDRWYNRSIDEHPLKSELTLKITSSLQPALKKLIQFDKGGVLLKHDGLEISDNYNAFKSTPWNFEYNIISKDESIYVGDTPAKKITHASLYLDDIFLDVLKAYKELTERCEFYFNAAIKNYPEHQPHMALFLTFIELFSYAQKELNGIPQRHLEFYYRDVLHLHERTASPDAVYLIYELAKEATEFDLKKGTSLTAGKDTSGKELIYKTENELLINNAKVKELKTIFLDKDTNGKTSEAREVIKKIYAAPIANSADGNGTPFKVEESAWPALGYFIPEFEKDKDGNNVLINGNNVLINEIGKEVEIGFAIASPQLFLAEGVRRIEINIKGLNILSELNGALEVHLTGEKELLKINLNEDNIVNGRTVLNNNITRYFITDDTIFVTIPASEKAIVAYDSKIHGEGYQTNFPVIKFILKDSAKYELLKLTAVTAITVNVIVAGMKNLILSNDDGPLDHTKPFNPFSLTPKPNSGFIIGNREIFSKHLTFLSLFFERKMSNLKFGDLKNPLEIDIGDSLKVNFELFDNRIWNPLPNSDLDFFAQPLNLNKKSFVTADKFLNRRNIDLSPDFSLQESSYGFLKFTLTFEETRGDQLKKILIGADALKRFSLFNALSLLLETNELIIDYGSEQNFEAGIEQFFHLYPFGIVETLPVNFSDNLNQKIKLDELESKSDNLIIKTNDLLPQIKFGTNKNNLTGENQYLSFVYQQGNLYIGIEDLVPPQNLSLLFKIADGTAEDNDNDPPKINWSYLVNNGWRPMPDENIVSDSTYGLQATGIILFDFPGDATNNNSIVTKGLHWLCASVDNGADKIPKIIDVIAQANKAIFYDQQNDPEHYRIPLPAQTIAKLSVKVPEVKIIQQPFESFDGKMREEGNVFYARASERLRHKNRAVTPWDYEHLVLEHFPGIYKVKCLTHTDPQCFCRHPQTNDVPPLIDVEKCCCPQIAPGHVLIVPISNLRNKNAVDILKPRTGRRTLLQIEEYLQKLTSPFVHVRAKNPKFEEIKTAFNVKFYTGTDKGKYLKQLNKDIIEFLTPWAFDVTKEIIFGGSVYASNIINFIEELKYVDYITCFRMIHIVKECCDDDPELSCADMTKDNTDDAALSKRFVNTIEATSSQAILTSAKKHCIQLIPDPKETDDCNCSN